MFLTKKVGDFKSSYFILGLFLISLGFGAETFISGIIYIILSLLLGFRVLSINKFIRWSLGAGMIASFSLLILLIGGFFAAPLFPVLGISFPLAFLFLVVGVVVSIRERLATRKEIQ